MKNLLDNDLLNKAVSSHTKGSLDDLTDIVSMIFEQYSIGDFHDIYWKIHKKSKAHLRSYIGFRRKLFIMFLESWENRNRAEKVFLNNDGLVKDILNLIVNELYNKFTIIDELNQRIANYKALSDNDVEELRDHLKVICEQKEEVNVEQSNLIEHIKQVFIAHIPQVIKEVNIDGDIKFVQLPDWHLLQKVPNELLLRLYLMGNKTIPVSAYQNYLTSDYISEEDREKDSQLAFDVFVYWFWLWAKKRKPTQRVPDHLKEFCADILQIVSERTGSTSYSAKSFKTDQPRNVEDSWYTFGTVANAAKKRIKENPLLDINKF